MRRVLVLFLIPFLFACEKIDFNEEFEKDDFITTRGAADFDPLGELVGIPVNIKLVNNGSNVFLSTSKKGTGIDLYNKDDESLRQRWTFKPFVNSWPVNGGSVCRPIITGGTQYNDCSIMSNGIYPNSIVPILASLPSIGGGITFVPISGTSNYHITALVIENVTGMPSSKTYYLHSTSYNGTGLKFSPLNQTGDRNIWQVVPVGYFSLADIKYYHESDDYIIETPELVDVIQVNNLTNPNPVTQSYEFTKEVTVTSSFSLTQGVTTNSSITSTQNVGTPDVSGGTLNTSSTISSSFSFVQNNSHSAKRSVKITFSTPIPPYSKAVINVYAKKYNVKMTYVATLRAPSGKTFRVKGKWTGIQSAGYGYDPMISYN